MKQILVVDDDFDFRQIITQTLTEPQQKVFSAEDGVAALKVISENQIDLVISDINMPGMDGITLLKSIRELNNHTPFVMLISGRADITAENAYELGASGMLSKPFSRSKLMAQVQSLLLQEKPRPPRHTSDLDVSLKFQGLDEAIRSKLFNLGRGGAFIRMNVPQPPLDTQIHFSFQFTGPSPVKIDGIGVVRWNREKDDGNNPAGVGIEFLFIDEPGRSLLPTFLDQLSRTAFIPKS